VIDMNGLFDLIVDFCDWLREVFGEEA